MRLIRIIFHPAAIIGLSALSSVVIFWQESIILSIILALLSIAAIYIWRSRETVLLYFLCAFLGAFSEYAGVYIGAWRYTNPDIMGVPAWLPLLWGLAGLSMMKLGSFISKYAVKN